MPSESRPIVFLSDFGLGNEWVGICHAVMTDIAPHSPIVDVSHLIRALHVVSGALLLADCMPDTSRDAVALAVVDLNVGKDREIAIETESGRALVGPDNSLLVPAAEADGWQHPLRGRRLLPLRQRPTQRSGESPRGRTPRPSQGLRTSRPCPRRPKRAAAAPARTSASIST